MTNCRSSPFKQLSERLHGMQIAGQRRFAPLRDDAVELLALRGREAPGELRGTSRGMNVDGAHPRPPRVAPDVGIGPRAVHQVGGRRSGAQDQVRRGAAVGGRDGVAEVHDAFPLPQQGGGRAPLHVEIEIVAPNAIVDHEHDVRPRRRAPRRAPGPRAGARHRRAVRRSRPRGTGPAPCAGRAGLRRRSRRAPRSRRARRRRA